MKIHIFGIVCALMHQMTCGWGTQLHDMQSRGGRQAWLGLRGEQQSEY
jgi:hypothetical protein